MKHTYLDMDDAALDNYIANLEQQITGDGYEPDELQGALEERQIRAECASDSRVAQALGRDTDDHSMFADPGGRSALRASSKSNPRNLPCPTCEQPNKLTPADKELGYQCDDCADMAESGGY